MLVKNQSDKHLNKTNEVWSYKLLIKLAEKGNYQKFIDYSNGLIEMVLLQSCKIENTIKNGKRDDHREHYLSQRDQYQHTSSDVYNFLKIVKEIIDESQKEKTKNKKLIEVNHEKIMDKLIEIHSCLISFQRKYTALIQLTHEYREWW